jgi:hypothetical protein
VASEEKMRKLKFNRRHFRETHQRWIAKGYQYNDTDSQELHPQCYNYIYFIELSGQFARDWGVCSNQHAVADGCAVFEHDGCAFHTAASDS